MSSCSKMRMNVDQPEGEGGTLFDIIREKFPVLNKGENNQYEIVETAITKVLIAFGFRTEEKLCQYLENISKINDGTEYKEEGKTGLIFLVLDEKHAIALLEGEDLDVYPVIKYLRGLIERSYPLSVTVEDVEGKTEHTEDIFDDVDEDTEDGKHDYGEKVDMRILYLSDIQGQKILNKWHIKKSAEARKPEETKLEEASNVIWEVYSRMLELGYLTNKNAEALKHGPPDGAFLATDVSNQDIEEAISKASAALPSPDFFFANSDIQNDILTYDEFLDMFVHPMELDVEDFLPNEFTLYKDHEKGL